MLKVKKYLNQNLAVNKYYLFQFLLGAHFFSAVTLPFFTDWAGLNFTQTMVLQSWFSFWIFVLEVPTGAVADFFSRKLSIVLGALIGAIGAIVYGSFPNFYLFLLGEFLFALCFALLSGASEAWLFDTLLMQKKQSQAKKILGRANSFNLVGMLVAAPLGGVIAQKFGLNAPMLAAGISFFIAFLAALTLKEPQIDTVESESKRYLQIIKKGYKHLKNNSVARAIILDSVIVSVSAYYVVWFEQAVLQQAGVMIKWFGLLHALMLLAEIVVSSQFEWLDKKLEKFSFDYAQLSAVLVLLGFLFPLIFQTAWSAVVFIVLSGGFGMTRRKYMSALLHQVIKSEQRATIISVLSMMRRMVIMIVNPGVGWLAQRNLNSALLIVGFLPALIFLLPSNYSLQKNKNKDNN